MMQQFFFIDSNSGEINPINKMDSGIGADKNQILQIVGIDSAEIYKGSIQRDDGSWIDSTNIIYTKFLNSENNENLSILVGNYVINSIKRIFPEIKYEIAITNINDGTQKKFQCDNYNLGLKSLI
jgi:hypothetical protein